MILQNGKKMSTRQGKSVKLHDVLEASVSLAKKYMKSDYQNINIEEKSDTSINVKQIYYLVNEKKD